MFQVKRQPHYVTAPIDLALLLMRPERKIRQAGICDLLRRLCRVPVCRFPGVAFSIHPNPISLEKPLAIPRETGQLDLPVLSSS